MQFRNLRQSLVFILNHPFNQDRKLRALRTWLRWQIQSRFEKKILYSYVNSARLVARRSQAGVTGNIYCGLHEWNEMAFTLHLLRPGDTFVDVGANVGSYTVLASACVGSASIAIEPVPDTYQKLLENIRLNSIEELVRPLNIGLGDQQGMLNFTNDQDTVNHVAMRNEKNTVSVTVDTLDHVCDIGPVLIKIDVEGFEYQVLRGATRILTAHTLCAMIIEWGENGSVNEMIATIMDSHGFKPMGYEPWTRKLTDMSLKSLKGNGLFIRNADFVQARLKSSVAYRVQGVEV